MIGLAIILASAITWQDRALEAIRAEPLVAETLFAAPGSLWISVKDDGTSRDGLANYFCLVTWQEGRKEGESLTVRILDVADLNRTLGKAHCP